MNILVAEDDKDLLKLITYQLEQEGYSCTAVIDGSQAFKAVQSQSFHLALFDIMMPLLDGYNLLRMMREAGNQIPVIFISARSDDMDKLLGLGLGADDYVVKPFNMAELIARVSAVLRRCYHSADMAAPCLRYGGLTLDTNGCDARQNGKSVGLGAKEYRLLKLLMENPGRVFTKKQIYRAVWDDDILYDDNTVMVHISHLRNKLEKNPKDPEYIKTIRGIGYKFQYDESVK